jgi:hypothetical protein
MAAEFPKMTLEQALALPNALQRNGGQPMDNIDAASALGKSPGSSTMRILNASASAYGLISGTYKTIYKMEPAGQAIVSPKSDGERQSNLVAAALRPSAFKAVFDYYKGKKFPEQQFFINTVVREFDVATAQAEKFFEVFSANLRFVGLVRDTPGGDWLASDAGSAVQVPRIEEIEDASEIPGFEDIQDEQPLITPALPTEPVKKARPNKLFIGHGRNKVPMKQLTTLLGNLGIPYVVVEDEPTGGRPISQKVREAMEECGAAILVFSADIEYFDKDNNPIWRPSENVSHELGAASVMYNDRIILFKEESISLASNYSGIGYIEFEKDKLDAKMAELLKELVSFKILRVSVGDDD